MAKWRSFGLVGIENLIFLKCWFGFVLTKEQIQVYVEHETLNWGSKGPQEASLIWADTISPKKFRKLAVQKV